MRALITARHRDTTSERESPRFTRAPINTSFARPLPELNYLVNFSSAEVTNERTNGGQAVTSFFYARQNHVPFELPGRVAATLVRARRTFKSVHELHSAVALDKHFIVRYCVLSCAIYRACVRQTAGKRGASERASDEKPRRCFSLFFFTFVRDANGGECARCASTYSRIKSRFGSRNVSLCLSLSLLPSLSLSFYLSLVAAMLHATKIG